MALAAWQKRASRMATTGRPMGRPAKPVEQHRLAGNPSKKTLPKPPLPGMGITASSSAPKAPELGDQGLALWFHVWEAGRAWLSPDSDYTIVRLLCEAQDEASELRRLLNSGEVERFYITANGQIVSHPVVTQLASIRTQLSSWLAAIGFSPSDRSRLGLAEVRVRDSMDELKARRIDRATGA